MLCCQKEITNKNKLSIKTRTLEKEMNQMTGNEMAVRENMFVKKESYGTVTFANERCV